MANETSRATPGPWRVDAEYGLRVLAYDERGTILADISGAVSNPTAVADAKLMAAAPDLADALEKMRQCVAEDTTFLGAVLRVEIDNALRKAGRIL